MGNAVLHAYTDGSYQSKVPGVVGAGYVLLKGKFYEEDQEIVYKYSGCSMEPELVDARNVGGEIMAALKAIDKTMEEGYDKLVIFHDYDGIGAWATGTWRTNTKLTKHYAEAVEMAREEGLHISFIHVDAHSDDEFNDMADRLAKSGVRGAFA